MKKLRESMPIRRKYARDLRANMPEAEHRLWYYLRKKQLDGCRFRRQHPVGKYIADFACVRAKLIIEVDGATHGETCEIAYDTARTVFLKSQDWKVIRYGNEEIYKNIDDVLDDIYAHLKGLK